MVLKVISAIFKCLLNTSLIASLAICVILLLKKCVGNRLNPNWHYCLWIIVLIRLIIPFNFDSSISIFSHLRLNSVGILNLHAVQKPANNAVSNVNKSKNMGTSTKEITDHQASSQQTDKSKNIKSNKKISHKYTTISNKDKIISFSILDIAALIWIIGISIALIYMYFIQHRFRKRIESALRVKCTYLNNMINNCKNVMEISKNIEVIRTKHISSPVLYGIIHPKILLPERFSGTINLEDLKYIFFHELSHYKRKDIIINYICNIVQIVYWFNPIIGYGFYKMKNDRESACDNMALNYLGEEAKIEYGKTILKLVKSYNEFNLVPGLAGIQSSKYVIKERVRKIKMFERSKLKPIVINIFTLIIAAVFLFTTALNNPAVAKVSIYRKINSPVNWMKYLKGNYKHVFSDKTKVTLEYAYVDGNEFRVRFIEELKDNKKKNFRIAALLKDNNLVSKPSGSFDVVLKNGTLKKKPKTYEDYFDYDRLVSSHLAHKPKAMVIMWDKVFSSPITFNNSYTVVLTKKIKNKDEKCEIKFPLYKENINLYKEIKINKVVKIKGGTLTIKTIKVSPHITLLKHRYKFRFELKRKGNAPLPDIGYSVYPDGKLPITGLGSGGDGYYPISGTNAINCIGSKEDKYFTTTKNNLEIKDIRLIFHENKNKVIKVPIPCKNKKINAFKSKIIIRKVYTKGKKTYFKIELSKKAYDDMLIPYISKNYSGDIVDVLFGKNQKSIKKLKGGNELLKACVESKEIKKNYLFLGFQKTFTREIEAYHGVVDIPIK